MSTHGTQPRPRVLDRVKAIRQMRGAQSSPDILNPPWSLTHTERPSSPMESEHMKEETRRRVFLPNLPTARLPRRLPVTCTRPRMIVAW